MQSFGWVMLTGLILRWVRPAGAGALGGRCRVRLRPRRRHGLLRALPGSTRSTVAPRPAIRRLLGAPACLSTYVTTKPLSIMMCQMTERRSRPVQADAVAPASGIASPCFEVCCCLTQRTIVTRDPPDPRDSGSVIRCTKGRADLYREPREDLRQLGKR